VIKQIQFRGQDDEGNVFCQPLWGHDFLDGLEKTAASKPSKLHPAVRRYIKDLKPTDKGVYILVSALGAGEYWGSNVNGDLFPEAALIHSPPNWNEMSPEEMKKVGKTWKYGFPSFMNAYPYKHHVNKDPSRAFGEVKIAVWNPMMHRVELVVYLDRALCKKWLAEDVINRIDNGEFPDVSMGCKVPHDICTICGHKSKTRKDYCDDAKLLMNKILPDGRKVAVRNDTPRFFDISFVFIGADKSAKMLAKLASVENQQCLGEFCSISRSSAEVGEAFSAPTELRAQDLADQWAMQKVATESFPIYEKTAGKAVKRQTTFDGHTLKIEVDAGDTRSGTDDKGKKWSREMKAAYGYIPKTLGKDGETVDIYLAVEPQAGSDVYVVRQLKKDGTHDEDKVMLGFSSKKAATLMYLKHIPAKLFGGATEMTPQAFSSYLQGHSKKASDNSCGSFDELAEAFLVTPGEKSASHSKAGEIIKSIPAGPFRKAMLPKLERAEGTLPKNVLKQMSKHAFDVSTSTAAMLGIVLKPQEFQHMVLTKIGEEALAEDLEGRNQVFAPSTEIDDSIEINEASVDPELKSSLMQFAPGRSIAAPALEKRASLVSQLNVRMSSPTPIRGDKFLEKVAELYNGYRRSLVKKASVVERSMASDPQLMLATAGESMVQAFAGGITKSASVNVLGPESLAYLVGAHYEDRDFHSEALAQSGVLAAA